MTKEVKIQNEALLAQQEGAQLQEKECGDDYQLTKVMQWLMPWAEKTDGEQAIGSWEEKLPTTMMVKLLELWLDDKGRERLRKMLLFYHPLDRAAMAYALVVYALTGHTMTFKTAVANQHYRVMCKVIEHDKAAVKLNELPTVVL